MMANKMQTHQLLWKNLFIVYYIIYIKYIWAYYGKGRSFKGPSALAAFTQAQPDLDHFQQTGAFLKADSAWNHTDSRGNLV